MAKKSTAVAVSPTGATPEQIAKFANKIVKGWGCVVPGAQIEEYDSNRKSISTGSTKLDWACTKPLVEGTINDIHALEGVGKTTLALEIAASATLMGKPVYYFDLERKLVDSQINMVTRLKKELFYRIRPGNGEDAVNKVIECVTDIPGCVVIFDSLTQMLPEVEDASGAEDQQMGLVARLSAKMIRKILAPVERNRCMVLFISHITANMEMYSGEIKTKGGKAVPNACAQRIHMKKLAKGKIKNGNNEIIGHNVTCKVVKNNQGLPYKEVLVPIIYGKGIERSLDLLQIAEELAIVEKAGGWYTYELDGETKKSYKDELLDTIRSNADFRNGLIKQIHEVL
jgi:recombination protein RecA